MTLDLGTIPANRLAMLETATLYHGVHGSGGPDCKHCARELIHEVVTGTHRDETPPGCTSLMAILPRLNDGPWWRDDAHRTEVMRPYLRKMLLLDPTKDEQRIYGLIDYVYRSAIPDIFGSLKLDKHASALRDLRPIMDRQSALVARDALTTLDRDALVALDALVVRDALVARDALIALEAIDAFAALNALASLVALDALVALAAIDVLAALAARHALAGRDASWEKFVIAVLDRVCEI